VGIRVATDQDWPAIYRCYSVIMAEGRTYAFPSRGVGRALGEYVIDWSRAAGFAGIQFNAVVEVNQPAVHLWKSLGFEVIGTVPEAFDHPDHGLVGLHVMYRRL
jgi:GNAT superfamily N-acetyltransferase